MKKGYTKVPNRLLEWLVRADLSGTELKIILAIIRKTYGFGKREDWISYAQLEALTSKSHWAIWPAIKKLVRKNLLVRKTKLH